MKKVVIATAFGVTCAVALVFSALQTQSTISQQLIRLHVRANSNTQEDQSLKLRVRDAVLRETSKITAGCTSAPQAEQMISENMDKLVYEAKKEISAQGFDYPVTARLGKSEFPTKTYGDMTLPAGTYKALTLEIGSGKGENWWCVMFPPLCFTEETVAVSANADKILMENLDDETYNMIKKKDFKVKFKIYESILNAGAKIKRAK